MLRQTIRILIRLPRAVQVLVLGNFINATGVMVGPFLSVVLVKKMALTPAQAGLIVGGFAAGTVISALIGGVLADRFGRRRTMMFSFLGSASFAVLLGFAETPFQFASILFCYGIVVELFRPASTALVVDLLEPHQRAEGIASLRVAQNLGYAAAMALGGILLDVYWRAIYFVDAGTTLAFCIVIWLWATEPKRNPAKAQRVIRDRTQPPWKNSKFIRMCFVNFLLSYLYVLHGSIFPLTIVREGGYSGVVVGWLLALNGVLITIFEIPIVSRVAKFGPIRVATLGTLLITLGLGLTAWYLHWAWFLFTVIFWTIGEILTFAILLSMIADTAPEPRRAQYISFAQASWRIASATSAPLMLPLYQWLGAEKFWPTASLVGVVAAALLARDISKRPSEAERPLIHGA